MIGSNIRAGMMRATAGPTAAGLVLGLGLLPGCAGPTTTSQDRAIDRAPMTTLSPSPKPAAYWKRIGEAGRGNEVDRATISALLTEMAGRRALQEAVLDAELARLLVERDRELDESLVRAELTLLLEVMSPDPVEAERLLGEIRLREGLGPVRFAALLRRNAALRTLVADRVEMREEALLATWDAMHGPTRLARVLVSPELAEAQSAARSIREGADFAEVAARRSTDASASTGGLLEPVSRLDPSWPTAFRETLWSLRPGEVSAPVLVDGDYLLVKFIEEQPGDGVGFEEGRSDAAVLLRRAQERILMDEEARSILEALEVDPVDDALDAAWMQRLPPLRSAGSPGARTRTE